MTTFILVAILIAGIILIFSENTGCLSLIIGIILVVFSIASLFGISDKKDKEFVVDVPLGQYQMEVKDAMDEDNKTIKKMAGWLIDNNTDKFKLEKYTNSFGCVIFEGTDAEDVYIINNKELRKLIEKEYINFIS